jgi:hypothetical protein
MDQWELKTISNFLMNLITISGYSVHLFGSWGNFFTVDCNKRFTVNKMFYQY